MNYLKRYLALKGVDVKTIANETGYGYHAVQKTVLGHRSSRIVRAAIADYLELPYDHVWGINAPRHLRRYIRDEIERRVQIQRNHLRKLYLEETLADADMVSNG